MSSSINYDDDIKKYRYSLYDIKFRINAIEKYMQWRAGRPRIIYVEYVCLQLRKILEDISLLSLVANREEYERQHEKFYRYYDARKILRDMKKVNEEYFPAPVNVIPLSERNYNIYPSNEIYLTEKKLLKIYKSLQSRMHAPTPYDDTKTYLSIDKDFATWLTEIKGLLKCHTVRLSNSGLLLLAFLPSEDILPPVYLMGPAEIKTAE